MRIFPFSNEASFLQSILEVPGDLCVTAADVTAEESIPAAAEGRGELTGLALWLIAERSKVGSCSLVLLTSCKPQSS